MLFISKEDFFMKAAVCKRLSREEEIGCAKRMREGDLEARERLVCGYIGSIASYVKRLSPELQTMELIYRLVSALEKAVDGFDFLQESESFSHKLSFLQRQTLICYIAEK